jgi:hypothetical protein
LINSSACFWKILNKHLSEVKNKLMHQELSKLSLIQTQEKQDKTLKDGRVLRLLCEFFSTLSKELELDCTPLILCQF